MGKVLRAVLRTIVIAIIFVVIFLFGASLYLSPQNKLKKSDAVVVISGGDTDARITEGVRIYKENLAGKIIFSGAAAEGYISNARAMKNIAVTQGVDADNIYIEEDSKTTEENAANVAKIIKEKKVESIILVTSPYHQRRAYNAFKKSLGEDFKIINHSATDKEWRKADWWSNEQARFLTVGEILKNLYSIFERKI